VLDQQGGGLTAFLVREDLGCQARIDLVPALHALAFLFEFAFLAVLEDGSILILSTVRCANAGDGATGTGIGYVFDLYARP